jgi:hypothetical protein
MSNSGQYPISIKEKTMPDMKTALNSAISTQRKTSLMDAINDWVDEEKSLSTSSQAQPELAKQRHYFQPTVGVSQASFNYVRDNPYTTAAQAVQALEKQGFKKTSLTSLYTQMIRQGHLSRDKDGKLTALIPEFRPLKATATIRNMGALLRKKLANTKAPTKADPPPLRPTKLNIDIRPTKQQNGVHAGIATLNASHAQAAPAPTLLTAKQVLETLSIKEAHMLYRELQTMFGG